MTVTGHFLCQPSFLLTFLSLVSSEARPKLTWMITSCQLDLSLVLRALCAESNKPLNSAACVGHFSVKPHSRVHASLRFASRAVQVTLASVQLNRTCTHHVDDENTRVSG